MPSAKGCKRTIAEAPQIGRNLIGESSWQREPSNPVDLQQPRASRKLYLQRDANTPILIPGRSSVANVNGRRPYLPGTFAEIAQTQTGANAHYDSLQMSLNRRFAHGFTLMANFTLSKSIDIASGDQLNPTVVSFVDSNNLGLDRARSDFDTPDLIARYFNTSAFKAAAGPIGAAGRNLVYGPGLVNWEFSAFKNFAITESKKGAIPRGILQSLQSGELQQPERGIDEPVLWSHPRRRIAANRTIQFEVFVLKRRGFFG